MAGEQLACPPLHSEYQTTLEMCQEGKGSGEGKGKKKKGTTEFLFLVDTEHASISLYLSREEQKQSCPSPTTRTSPEESTRIWVTQLRLWLSCERSSWV